LPIGGDNIILTYISLFVGRTARKVAGGFSFGNR